MAVKTIYSDLPVIPKSGLVDGAFYIGKTYQRNMPIGLWDGFLRKFICSHSHGNGVYDIYKMPHIEDDNGTVCFEPVKEIEILPSYKTNATQ